MGSIFRALSIRARVLRPPCAAVSPPPPARRLENADELTGARCCAHSDLRGADPVILCDPLLAGPAHALPSTFIKKKKEKKKKKGKTKKNPISAKVEIEQVESIAYFMLP